MYFCSGAQRHAWDDAADAAKCCNGYERAHRVSRRPNGTLVLTYYWRKTAEARRTTIKRVEPKRALDVPHDAFFKRLGEAAPGTPHWRAVSAGLVTVRLVERCATRKDPLTRMPEFRELLAVRRAIRALDEGPIQLALSDVIDAISADGSSTTQELVGALNVYGHQLEADGEWRLASDVFGLVVTCATAREDQAPIPDAYFHVGLCRRKLGDLEGAHISYQAGRQVAEAIEDRAGVLKLDIGEARIAIERGNYPEAEERLDAIIAAAQAAEIPEVEARALHDRGLVAKKRERIEAAMRYYFDALRRYETLEYQQRAMHDIAQVLLEIGARADAQRGFEVLFETALQQETKWAAAINLLDVAACENDWALFEAWRTQTASVALPPELNVYFKVVLGDGYRRFAKPLLAIDAYEEASLLAVKAGLHEFVARAEEGRKAVREVPARMTAPATPLPSALSEVVAGVEAIVARHRAGVGRE
jgi:tetratricopeptide (TPR) repeat protein